MENEQNRLYKCFVCGSVSGIITLFYFYLILLPDIKNYVGRIVSSVNIAVYIFGVAVFFLIFSLLYLNKRVYSFFNDYYLFILMIFFECWCINRVYENEREVYIGWPIYEINKFVLCLICVLITLVILFWGRKLHTKVFNCFAECISIGYVVFCVCRGLSNGYPFYDRAQVVNSEATLAGIYNLFYGEPVSDLSYCIYGHYGLFYAAALKMTGFSYKRLMCLQIALAILIVSVFIYAIKKMTHNVALRFPFIVSLGLLWGQLVSETYNDNAIIRIAPGAAIVWYIVFVSNRIGDKNYKTIYTIGYVISSLGIIWNLEFGMVATVTWSVFVLWHSVCYRGKKLFLFSTKAVLMSVIAFLMSWIATGLINYLIGGRFISLRTYCIPHWNKTYMVDSLQMSLERSETYWLFFLLVMLFVCTVGFKDLLQEETRKASNRNAVSMCVAVNAIGGAVYFINRCASGNLFVVWFQFILAMAIASDDLFGKIKKRDSAGIKLSESKEKQVLVALCCGLIMVASGFAIGTICEVEVIHYNHEKATIQPTEAEINEFVSIVPENTPAIGKGVISLYTLLGWDTMYHYSDDMSLTPEAIEALNEALEDSSTSKVISANTIIAWQSAGLMRKDMLERLDEIYDVTLFPVWSNGWQYLYLVPK